MALVSEITKYLIIVICILVSPLSNETSEQIFIDAISLHDGEIETLLCYMEKNHDTIYFYPNQLQSTEVIFKITPIGSKKERYLFEHTDQGEEVIDLRKLIKDFNMDDIKEKGKENKTLRLTNGSFLYLLYRGNTVYLFSEELNDIVFAIHE